MLHKRNANPNAVIRVVEAHRTYYCKEHFWIDFPVRVPVMKKKKSVMLMVNLTMVLTTKGSG